MSYVNNNPASSPFKEAQQGEKLGLLLSKVFRAVTVLSVCHHSKYSIYG